MNAFSGMLDALFADPNMGTDATYAPPGGGPAVPCRVILSQGDRSWRYQDAGVTTPARVAEVRVSEVAEMEEEGVLTINGTAHAIQKASQPDPDRLVWRLELN